MACPKRWKRRSHIKVSPKALRPTLTMVPRIRNWTRGGSLEQQHLGATASDSLRDPASPSRTSSQILARIAELRPVLPRPTQGGPVHDPSTGTPHGHTNRHHDNKPYQHTPYGVPHQHALTPPSFLPSGNLTTPFAFNEQSSYNSSSQIHMMGGSATDWPPREGDNSEFQSISPSSCGCGDACRCPGCVHHNRTTAAPSSSAYSSCHNPELCMTCLDCTIMSLPSSAVLPLDTALSIYDPQLQNDAIDDWLRQMSFTLPSDNSPSITTGTYPLQSPPTYQQPSPSNWNNQSNYPFPEQQNEADPLSTFNFGLSATQSMMSYSPSTSHTRNASYSAPASRTGHRLHSSLSVPSSGTPVDPRLLGTGVPMNVQQFSNFMSQARSRSPSTSSQSSFHGSDHQGGTAAIPTPPYRPSGRMQGMPTQAQGLRSMPHLDIRPNIHRGPSSGSSASISPSPGSSAASSATRAPYAASNPETRQPDYDPSGEAQASLATQSKSCVHDCANMSTYDNILQVLSDEPAWTQENEEVNFVDLPAHIVRLNVIYLEQVLLEPFRYITSNPGKEIRGKLIEAFNLWLNVPSEKLQVIAKIVNMLHAASLMVDDIEDDSQLRRGNPVTHKIYGVPQTINTANYVYFLAYQELFSLRGSDTSEKAGKALHALVTGNSIFL
ncbi:hypothetical protein D9613_011203 [Agrocybe pediades]|uniref:(2E,6E)-farnesyl diphosphate synthase n=1 Tax=Agrocybe pediades TaxID=84607 RepID=A0A8H4VKK1_9AGAR|nr:hypothetical protein D9613_011203 [Agrocybe pediades]